MIGFRKLAVALAASLAAGSLSLAACSKSPPAPGPVGPAVAAAPLPAPTPTPASIPAKPALWRIGDTDTTVYLLGTVHVLPPQLQWRTPVLEDALKAAKAVYFETDVNPNQLQLIDVVKRLGMYPSPDKLSNHLKPADRAAVADAAGKLSIPMLALDTMKPWLAAATLSEEMVTKSGYDPSTGVERTLLPLATDQGKEIRKLETVEEQLLIFADLPEKVQVTYLMAGVKEIDKEKDLLTQMVEAWRTGDIATLDKIMLEDDLEEAPEVYQALLVKRNRNWTVKLDQLVKDEPGVFFVAVGAGHLAGKDSVIGMLEKKGYKVERVE